MKRKECSFIWYKKRKNKKLVSALFRRVLTISKLSRVVPFLRARHMLVSYPTCAPGSKQLTLAQKQIKNELTDYTRNVDDITTLNR